MSLDKKSIAAVGAAATALAVVTGGYCVSFANYSSTLEKARLGIEQYITRSGGFEPGQISVAFFEPESALFNHKVTLVVTDGEVSFKLPMTINSGYANYTIDLDLINATINQENALKHFDLTELTKIEASGKLNLISGQLSFVSNASFLNDSQFLRDHAFASAFDKFQKLKAQEALERAKSKQTAAPAPAETAPVVADVSEQQAVDTQEIASVDTIKNTPVTADMDTQAAGAEAAAEAEEAPAFEATGEQVVAEAQADATEQAILEADPVADVSEQQAVDSQEIASVDTIKNTPVTADTEAAAEAAAQAQAEITITELPEEEAAPAEAAPVEAAPAEQAVAQAPVEAPAEVAPAADEMVETDGLNNLKEMAIRADADKDEARLSQLASDELQKLIKEVGFKQVGNLMLSVSIDRDENIKSSLSIDSVHRNGMGFSNINVFGENKGLLAVKSIGRSELSVANAYEVSYNGLTKLHDIVMKLNCPYTSKNGNFNLDYVFKLGSYGEYKNIETSGSLNGLNVALFNSEDTLDALGAMIVQNGLELTFNKGSKFEVASHARSDQYSKVEPRNVTVGFNGKVALPKGEDFNLFFSLPQGEINFNLDLDARNLVDPAFISDEQIIKGFEIKDGKSYGKVELTKDNGLPAILVNGQPIF